MNKRLHTTAFDEGPRLRIKLARTGEPGASAPAPLDAEAHLVRMYSAVARRLPETEEWDLSGLLVDGQPASRATAVAWLNAAYQLVYDTDYEQQQGSPACSAEGLYRLLAFADAVDSMRALLKACCAGFAAVDASAEQQGAFRQQVAAQTEQLLRLAYRLQLEPLQQRLHAFIRPLQFFRALLLTSACAAVFTPRVLEAAGVASLPGGKQMLINSVVGEIAEMAETGNDVGVGTWLQPTAFLQGQGQPLRLNAVVKRSGLRLAQGSVVPVELDLFGDSTIMLGERVFPVQLRIGNLSSALIPEN